jgi:structural maintenance of chromosome 4
MASISPRKSTRATATRRKAPVADDSDEDENRTPTPEVKQEEDEEEFTPAPAPLKTGRGRGRAKKPADENATPKAASRRRPRVTESVEPTQLFTPARETTRQPSPSKTVPKKRGRKPRESVVTAPVVEDSQLLTPEPSISPEPEPTISAEPEATSDITDVSDTPLADSTDDTIGETTPVPTPAPELRAEDVKVVVDEEQAVAEAELKTEPVPEPQAKMVENVNSQHTVLERPMDIVAKRRAAAMPALHEPAPPKQRTVITWLVMTNFKSYAGRQEVGPFHASFSSVVGPNGSGKSNVIDSLLFVFGFRASKMRQGKLSALIHNSAGFQDLDFCAVEVHFEEVKDLPNGGQEVIPDSQLVISRRAFKNNSSKYYINNKESTFTIVTTLLKDRGVDLDHKRFLILQGEVESIAQMKPKAQGEHDDGLLEYLEDIIGTSKYKTPIEESAAEVETLNEVCQEKNSRVQHVEKEEQSARLHP